MSYDNINTNISSQKKILRKQLKIQRAELSKTHQANYSETIQNKLLQLPEIKQATRLFCYLSFSNEVKTHTLVKKLLSMGKIITIPYIATKHTMYAVRLESWQQLHPGEMGILTRPNIAILNRDTSKVDTAIIPGLGFSITGQRIGFGNGYYDRWLTNDSPGCKLAVAFEKQLVSTIPTAQTDVDMDLIVTEKRIIDLRI